MRLLLPPSETKRDGVSPGPLDLSALVAPALASHRERLIGALSRYCNKPTPTVRAAIGTSVKQDAELLRNARLVQAAVSPASAIYDGVLFDAIEFNLCSAPVRQRITNATLVQSALFGIVGFGDAIPAYRCSADSRLPRIGRLAGFWRTRLATAMSELTADRLLLDMRSGTYASMWTPPADPERVATVRIMQLAGTRKIAVSHFNKATKGQLVRALCEQRRAPRTVAEAADVIAAAGYEVDVVQQGSVFLDVMLRAS